MQLDVYNLKNEAVGKVEAPADLFTSPWNPQLVRQVITAQLANRRRPWASVKGRGEVRGGGRKPWRQKGTGRARHGSIRSPLWVGGGKAHGPVAARDYSQKINRKMKQGALASVLSKKHSDGEVKIFESLQIDEPKTKKLQEIMRFLLCLPSRVKKMDALLIAPAENTYLSRAARNLVKTKVLHPQSLNVYDLLNYRSVFIDSQVLSSIAKVSGAVKKKKATV